MTKVAINGFGRIGRLVARAILERPDCGLELVAINDLADAKANAWLFSRDSVHGKFPGEVTAEGDAIIVNGKRMNACLSLAVMHDGDEITTIEGLGTPEALDPMQRAFVHHDGFQCGYCTPGQLCSAVGMMNEGHAQSRDEIREAMSGNICRCGAYTNIVDAIEDVMQHGGAR